MARPRTYAPPVAFRLPPEWNEKLEDRALRSGLPLAVYVREQVVGLLKTLDAKDTREARKTRREREERRRTKAAVSANGD